MTTYDVPMCLWCRHFHRDDDATALTCDAFPDRIPDAILKSTVDHRRPYLGDHGIRFVPEQGMDVPEEFQPGHGFA